MSDSDVYYKVDPHTDRGIHRYSNKAKWANYDEFKLKKPLVFMVYIKLYQRFNPFEPEFTIVVFIHYKSRIAVAILDL